MLGGEALIFLGVDCHHRLACLGHAADDAAADVDRVGGERLLRQVARHLHFQFAAIIEQQHSPLGARQADDGVHHQLKHHVEVKRGVDGRANPLQGA